MIEALLVLGTVGTVATVGLLGPWIPLTGWLWAGAACTALGLGLGVPTGLLYHLRLRACLRARGELPPRWWLHPTDLHGRLHDEERDRVLRWFFAGGVGFVFAILGCALVVLGLAFALLER